MHHKCIFSCILFALGGHELLLGQDEIGIKLGGGLAQWNIVHQRLELIEYDASRITFGGDLFLEYVLDAGDGAVVPMAAGYRRSSFSYTGRSSYRVGSVHDSLSFHIHAFVFSMNPGAYTANKRFRFSGRVDMAYVIGSTTDGQTESLLGGEAHSETFTGQWTDHYTHQFDLALGATLHAVILSNGTNSMELGIGVMQSSIPYGPPRILSRPTRLVMEIALRRKMAWTVIGTEKQGKDLFY